MSRPVIGLALAVWLTVTCGGTAVLEPSDDGDPTGTTTRTSNVTTSTASGMGGTGPVSSVQSTVVTTGSSEEMCWQQPDFDSCVGCLCQFYMAECQSYIGVLTDHFYCGATCGMLCADYCSNPNNPPPPRCEMCISGIDCGNPAPGSPQEADCDNAIAVCQADMGCITFVQLMQGCPF